MNTLIFELTKPGTWLVGQDRQWEHNISNILISLESVFYEANLSLNLFNEASLRIAQSFTVDLDINKKMQEVQIEMEKHSEISRGLEHKYDLSIMENREKLSSEARLIMKRQKWIAGELPHFFTNHAVFIYAKSFLYSLDTLQKLLCVLCGQEGIPDGLSAINTSMKQSFPDLKKVRNSSHHIEERVMGKSYGKPIDLKPIDKGGIKSEGGSLVLSNLNGTRYGCTLEDGYYGEVDVTPESMEIIRIIVQRVFDSFKWKGPEIHLPI